ncbi:putative short-chain oxidoreductase [Lentinula edodes]|nr:putative short-chain oxidoreductase [Lentinula edodes]
MATESSVDEVSSNSPVVLITGCSTGLGRALVLEAASQGLRVIATARKISAIENLRAPNIAILTLDVTASMSQLEDFANKALTVFGQVDILINNAGYPLVGALEEVSSDQTLAIFNTNFFGSLNVSNVFLPHFRARRSGTIINISSMMPYITTPGSGPYTATKAALDTITKVWAGELAPFKIRVMGVSLGFTRTELLGSNLSTVENTIPDYAIVRELHEQVRALHGHEPNDVQKVAKRILDVVLTYDELPVMFPLGDDAVTSADEYLNQRRSEFEKWKELGMGVNADD